MDLRKLLVNERMMKRISEETVLDASRTEENREDKWKSVGFRSIDRFCARPGFEAGLQRDHSARRVARGVKTRA